MVERNSLLGSIIQESSIHGVRHITDIKRNKISRILWFFLFIGSMCGLIFSAYGIYLKWNVEPESGLRVNYKPMTELPFPSVTICPPVFAHDYKANYTRFIDPDPESRKRKFSSIEQNYLAANIHRCLPVMGPIVSNCDNRTRFDTVNLMRHSSICTQDFLRSCILAEKRYNCSAIINRVLTDYGFCYTFNMQDYDEIFNNVISKDFSSYQKRVKNQKNQWKMEEGYLTTDEKDVFPIRLSKSNTLSLLFYLSENDTMNNCQAIGRVFTIILHQPNEIPTVFHEELYIPFGNRKTVILTAKILKTAESLRKYLPEKRGCYFEGERQLKFFKSYTKAHCDFECMANYTFNVCGCMKFSMPRTDDVPICDVDKINCYSEAMMDWPRNAKYETPCGCLPTCNSIKYSVHFQKDAVLGEFLQLHPTGGELRSSNGTFSFLYMRTKSHAVDEYETFVAYRLQNFIADLGGLLGLFLGCSILSLIELIFFTITAIWNKKMGKRNDIEFYAGNVLKQRSNGVKNILVQPYNSTQITMAFEHLNMEMYANKHLKN
ncbi:hypothetical protein PVAND_013003 [Polypedilum vanderplanki]|uniref:Uncharacterized protein n=1 Tax=Polypedilum vanderplanki TaxID=319348 RepID=A0A9J6CN61_POLVA|nr:hypothetical protein PVAND_013003 [Polypedilum vanderplanki]